MDIKNINTNKIIRRTFILLAGFLILLIILQYFKIIQIQQWLYPGSGGVNPSSSGNQNNNGSQIIARVGTENIYRSDLDFEVWNYPFKEEGTEKLLLDKIIEDSIIIQSAQKDGFIKIDKTVFNSPQKDYLKRVELVKSIKTILDNRQDTIKGNIVAVWFLNRYPGKAGLERGKATALDKITSLHRSVKNNEITILQAAQKIIDDNTLEDIDPDYATNAIISFEASPEEKITRDEDFDKVIRNLKVGEISDVFTVKDLASGSEQKQETAYMFAQITERKNQGQKQKFDDWLLSKKKNYEIVYY